jgi:hypothetical protein
MTCESLHLIRPAITLSGHNFTMTDSRKAVAPEGRAIEHGSS